ncbi:bifunctional DNA primase/polymerase [Streptomyces nitrosporeus]|uniref:DNA primase n=1 Tax=Streptomyces nitrosporeus TaxID=28894 RepID=A0A5J6FKI3_9ACTN|nr:DNA primase [Streptomyces nitrosporeus]GGZ14362.1 DNA primase [Streptomyces nitrosporeus]
MEERSTVTEAPRGAHVPRQRGERLAEAAAWYAEERRWDVVAGTRLDMVDGSERCSCGRADCAWPGAHPAGPHWAGEATGGAAAARRMWDRQPGASVLLPAGRAFDALDVPESAGFLALARMERMGLPAGPVTRTPDRRTVFLVAPGGAAKAPVLVRSLGWDAGAIGLVGRGEGHYVVAPPTRVGGRGAVQWARPPGRTDHRLPDVQELIGPLAYACAREASDARSRLS